VLGSLNEFRCIPVLNVRRETKWGAAVYKPVFVERLTGLFAGKPRDLRLGFKTPAFFCAYRAISPGYQGLHGDTVHLYRIPVALQERSGHLTFIYPNGQLLGRSQRLDSLLQMRV
jgi:hypothetical protein